MISTEGLENKITSYEEKKGKGTPDFLGRLVL